MKRLHCSQQNLVEERTKKLSAFSKIFREEIQERKQAEVKLTKLSRQLHNLNSHLETNRDEEKKRIAREIHDEVGQALSILKIDLAWLKNHLPRRKKFLFEKIEEMSSFIDQTIQKVQKISQELRSSVLENLEFTAVIAWQLEDFQRHTGIPCQCLMRIKEVNLDQDSCSALYRVVQESLTNILRHAHATSVQVIVEKETSNLRVMIIDDGIGIPRERIYDPKSLGLIGIRERICALEGKVKFIGRHGQGTTVLVALPLKR